MDSCCPAVPNVAAEKTEASYKEIHDLLCSKPSPEEKVIPYMANNKEKAMRMSEANANVCITANAVIPDETATQRSYLDRRLSRVYRKKLDEARRVFKMDWTDDPKTPGEVADRLKTGKFTYNSHYVNEDGSWKDDCGHWDGPMSYFDWRTEPADKVGYKAFDEKLADAKTVATDAITILSPQEGLEAINTFEAMPIQ